MYLIEVTGDIYVESGIQHAQGWTAYQCGKTPSEIENSYKCEKLRHLIEGNLVLSKECRSLPFAYYIAHGGIQCNENSDIVAYSTPCLYFNQVIEETREKLNVPVQNDLETIFYKGLFIDVFSSIELLLSDHLLYLIFNNTICYENAVQLWNPEKNIEDKIIETARSTVFHRFENVDKLYQEITGKKLPSYSSIKKWLHKRNNIVHRCAISGLDFMTSTNPTKKDVSELIKESCKFAEELSSRQP